MSRLLIRLRISIFPKLAVIFIMIIFFIYAFSMFLYSWGLNRLKRETLLQQSNNVHLFLDNLEKEFNRIISMEAEMIFDDNLRILLTNNIYDDTEIYYAVNELNAKVNGLLRTSSYITQSCVYILDRNLKVSNLINSEITPSEWEMLGDMGFVSGFPFIEYKDRFYINIHSHYYKKDFAEPELLKFVISVQLDAQKLRRDLASLSDEGHAALISLGSGLSVYVDEEARELFGRHAPLDMEDKSPSSDILPGSNPRVYFSAEKSERLDSMIVLYIMEENMLSPFREYTNWFYALTAVTLIIVLLFVMWIRHIVVTPLGKIIEAIKRGIDGDISPSVPYKKNDEFGYIYEQFNEMVNTHTRLIDQIYKQQILIKDAQLKQLQYQINPHFLYNSFFILYRMSEAGEYETMSSMLMRLSHYYKNVTKNDSPFVMLADEFGHSRDYLEIQSIRFAGRISVELDSLPESYAEIRTPRLILQPIFENCYAHGLKNKESGGVISCKFTEDRDALIHIEDNGGELSDDTVRLLNDRTSQAEFAGSSGLMNINQRLQLAFGGQYGLMFDRGVSGGLRVTVRLPGRCGN